MPELSTIVGYLPYIISGVFALIILNSLLFGLKRGAYRSTFRFATVLFSFFVALFFAGVASSFIVDFDFSTISFVQNLLPNFTSIAAFIQSAISNIPEIANLMAASPAFAALVTQFPLLIANIFMFFFIFYTLKFLTWFVYAIASKIHTSKKKRKAREEQKAREVANGIIINYYDNAKPARAPGDRSWGALIGVAQGLILALVFFLPFNGLINMYFDVRNALDPNAVQAYEVSSTYETQIDLDQYIPAEVHNALVAYRQSAPSIVFGFMNVDRLVFDQVSSIQVDGKRVVLTNEIKTVAQVYYEIDYFMQLDYNNIDLKTFDFARLEAAVNAIFNSDVVKIIAPELLEYYGNDFASQAATGDIALDEIKLFLPLALASVDSETMQSDILAVVRTAKELQAAGIFHAMEAANPEVAVMQALTQQNATKIVNAMLSSHTLRQGLVYGINRAFEVLDEELNIEITKLVYDNVSWANVSSSFGQLLSSIAQNNLLQDVVSGSLDMSSLNASVLLSGEYRVADLGKILDIAKNNPLLSDALTKVVHSYQDHEVFEYVDLAVLVDSSYSYEAEYAHIDTILSIINAMKASDDTTLVSLLEAQNIDFDDIVALLAENQEDIEEIVNELLQIKTFRASAGQLMNMVAEVLSTQLNTTVVQIDGATINWTNESVRIAAIVNKLIAVTNQLDFALLQSNGFSFDLIEGNLVSVGEALDLMKESELLGGVYDQLVQYLSGLEELNAFVNFNAINQPGFSWASEFAALQNVVTILNNNNLLEGFGSGSIEDVLQQLTPEDVSGLVEAVIGSELLSDVAINAINEVIDMLNTTEGINIDLIDLGIDLSSQSDNIVDVIVSVLPIIDSLSGNIDIETLSPEEFGGLLNVLADSQEQGGIFSGVYDSMVNYLLADETYGDELANIYDAENVGANDWVSILNQLMGA